MNSVKIIKRKGNLVFPYFDMHILFITFCKTVDIKERGIYSDLLRKFHKEGHELFIVYPIERKEKRPTTLYEEPGIHYLGVYTLNIQQSSIVEKGIGTLLVESQFEHAIHKYFNSVSFDLILYSTPPITFTHLIGNLKRSNPKATTYLLLKDIFPQNAVDLEMFGKKSLFYYYFRSKEKTLYRNTDFIGCMSPANVDYIIRNNPEVDKDHVEVCPNSIELSADNVNDIHREEVLQRYGIPSGRPIFLYGGNLGKPQGIPFFIKCLDANSSRTDCHILVVGTGTELKLLQAWYLEKKPKSVTVMNGLPKNDYDILVQCCDVGLVFLDHRFTIPNYPSRILSYLENKMPVLCATDSSTDIGRIAEKNGYGYWCESDSVEAFTVVLDKMIHSNMKEMGENGYRFLKDHYLVDNSYNIIMQHV